MTYADAITNAGRVLAAARARRDALPARQAAVEAYEPGGPSVDELAASIEASRTVDAAA